MAENDSNIRFKGLSPIFEHQSGVTYTENPTYVERSGVIYKLLTIPSSSVFIPGEWLPLTSAGSGTTFPSAPLTSIQFNSSNAFGGSSAFTWSNSSNALTVGHRSGTVGAFSATFGGWNGSSIGQNEASGAGSIASGYKTIASGVNSASFGVNTIASGNSSQAEGYSTIAGGSGAHTSGWGSGTTLQILASGLAGFNHSQNTVAQTFGHGALATNSAILGGRDHNIESGNTGATIIGGNAIKLTGTSYTGHTAVDNLAIFSQPISGDPGTVEFLARNPTTNIVQRISRLQIIGSGTTQPGGPDTSIQFHNNNQFSGVTEFNFDAPNNAVTIGTRGAGVVGRNSISIGTGNTVTTGASFAGGYDSTAGGVISGSYKHASFAFGVGSIATGNSVSISMGFNTIASGNFGSHAEGYQTIASGTSSHSEGSKTIAGGVGSHAGGVGFSGGNEIIASGNQAFIHSENNNSQTAGHGALANNSAIIGGLNHNIEVGNTGATIIGGNTIKLAGTTYIDTTAVDNLAIISTPNVGTTADSVLVRSGSTGVVAAIPQADIAVEDKSIVDTNPLSLTATTSTAYTINLTSIRKVDFTLQANATGITFTGISANTSYLIKVINEGSFDFSLDYNNGADGGEIHSEGGVEFITTGGGSPSVPTIDMMTMLVNDIPDQMFITAVLLDVKKPVP